MNDYKDNNQPGIRRAVTERTLTLILGGLGLVAALAWNDAIQAFFQVIFGTSPNSILAKFTYAVVITAIITVISIRLSRYTSSS